jgi:predicted CDP-diglyceride synthetase/phosphatidate cytidylyltransferase
MVTDIFPSTDNGWWVMASIIIFVIIIPLLNEITANVAIISFDKIRKGEFLSVIFKPLKSIFAVVSIYGVMALEYKVIHGKTESTLFEVFVELLKSI